MPSGKTHDAITFLITVPVFLIAWTAMNFRAAALVTICFLIGGFIFGPDLDTKSNQYLRWGIFRFLWFPYKTFFPHRSRWSHGLIFGTLIRAVYFAGILTLISFLVSFLIAVYSGGQIPEPTKFVETWRHIGEVIQTYLGRYGFYFAFIGLWFGAASHTFTDIVITYIKTGRAKGLL